MQQQSDIQEVAPPEPLLVPIPTAAKMCGLGESYFRKLVDDGTIGPAPIRLGKRVLMSVRELREWEAMGRPDRREWLRRADFSKSVPSTTSTGIIDDDALDTGSEVDE